MKKTAEALARQLDAMAAAYALTPIARVGPWRQILLTLKVDGCTFRLKAIETPDELRHRAERLRKSARGFGTGLTGKATAMRSAARWKPPTRRPKSYSKTLAQQFLDDGERENWEAYRDLFDA